MTNCRKREFLTISFNQLFAVGLGFIGGKVDFRKLSVFKEEQHIAFVVGRNRHINCGFAGVHMQMGRDEIAQHARFCIVKVRRFCLIDLTAVCKEQQIGVVGRFKRLNDAVAVFKLLLAAHTKRLRRNLFEIAVFCKEQMHRVIRDFLDGFVVFQTFGIQDFTAARLVVFFHNVLKLGNDNFLYPRFARKNIFHILNIRTQIFNVFGAFEDIFAV